MLINKRIFIVSIFLLIFLFVSLFCSWASTYYVDPSSGSDSNDGLSTSTPWQHIPGTRKLDNTGYNCPSVTIQPGDLIFIKSGTTHIGVIYINTDYYSNSATPSNRISIKRDINWGTGSVIFTDSNASYSDEYQALINIGILPDGTITPIPYLTISGIAGISSSYDGFIVSGADYYSIRALGTSEASKCSGLEMSHVKCINSGKQSYVIQRQDSFTIEWCEADGGDNDLTTGFYIGGSTYGCSNGIISNCISHNNGDTPRGGGGGGNLKHGFWITDSHDITISDCLAYDNEGDGFDNGTVSNSVLDDNIIFKRCRSYNNDDGFAANAADSTGNSRFYFVSCLAYENNIGCHVYNGPTVYIYNCTFANNSFGVYLSAPSYSNRDTLVTMKNCVLYQNNIDGDTNDGDLCVYDSSDLIYTGDYNLFDQGNGDQRVVRWCIADIGCTNINYYYSGGMKLFDDFIAEQNEGVNSHDSAGDNKQASFIDPANNNYYLRSSSDCVDSGIDLGTTYNYDLDNISRPQGSAWDIGAYEYRWGNFHGVSISGGISTQ